MKLIVSWALNGNHGYATYPSSHNHGSKEWVPATVPPTVATLKIQPFSTSIIMGERVCILNLGIPCVTIP